MPRPNPLLAFLAGCFRAWVGAKPAACRGPFLCPACDHDVRRHDYDGCLDCPCAVPVDQEAVDHFLGSLK